MKAEDLVQRCPEIVNELTEAIEYEGLGLKEAEERIVEFMNRIGDLMIRAVAERVKEPTVENRLFLDGQEARYVGMRNMRFRNRFGGETVRSRRCYRWVESKGCIHPLDEKLGVDKCYGFSPLMTYLQTLYGGSRPYEESSRLLGNALGFAVSATAVQRNTEEVGRRLDDEPIRVIDRRRRDRKCKLMVVEMDGTTSPQIHQEKGIEGRESLRQPTEWKQCNVATIQKINSKGQQVDFWSGARYGATSGFSEHLRRAALMMGQMNAVEVVFIADGLPINWQVQMDHFPSATTILDFYHASEHLRDFCKLFKDEQKGDRQYQSWRRMLLEGEVLQVMAEMKVAIPTLNDVGAGWREYRYYQNNCDRMRYAEYREAGYPIGSGQVEGSCKFVVGKRFKGSGMRWKKSDNECVLKARLAFLNDRLAGHFEPSPKPYSFGQQAA